MEAGRASPRGRIDAMLVGEPRMNEGELVRALLSPTCPAQLVEHLAGCSWVLRSRRLLALVVRHRACPVPFAWEAMPHLGWHDLLEVARHPRAAPRIRRQAEHKLLDRLPHLAPGERVSLARFATRALVAALLGSDEKACVEALLDNPQFTERDALRLMGCNRNQECLLAVVKHRRWGRVTGIVAAALRTRGFPVAISLGILATCTTAELARVQEAPDVPALLRDAAGDLLEHRQRREDEVSGRRATCASRS